jgi:amino acid permease
MFFEDVLSLILAALGFYGIYRFVRKAWHWSDIKETDEQLAELKEQEQHVEKVQKKNPINREEAWQKLNKYTKGGQQ